MKIKLFLDDIRCPTECASYMYQRIGDKNPTYLEGGWLIVRNYDQFVAAIRTYSKDISHISYDHDLHDEHYTPEEYWGDYEKSAEYQASVNYKEKTGCECAKWMKEYYDENHMEYPEMWVHSMNPVGTQNIINVFK